ncbi:putative HECT-type ubiquitin ligase-interacting protein creD [Ilyonectria robusta]
MRSFLKRFIGAPKARLTIRPACDFVFLFGSGEEARGQYLRGKLILFEPNGESILGVRLRMTGRILLGDHQADTDESAKWLSKELFFHQWEPFLTEDQISRTCANGRTYEWPFELFIDGNQEESFRGCSRCSLNYRLEASAFSEDNSNSSWDFAPIRIIRCPALSAYELIDPITTHGKWAGKVEYNVSMAHQAIALGGLIPVDAQLAKLEPGVQVVKARFFLREVHSLQDETVPGRLAYEGQRTVMEWPLTIHDTRGQMHSWQQCFDLPRIVRKCSPDLSACMISISHTLYFAVTLMQSNGTVSEYESSIPIILFVSPELPVNGWGIFVQENQNFTSNALDILAEGLHVPPKYCIDEKRTGDYESIPEIAPPPYCEH